VHHTNIKVIFKLSIPSYFRPLYLCPLSVRSLSALCPLSVRSLSALCPLSVRFISALCFFFDLVSILTTSVFFFCFLPACCPLVVRLLPACCPLVVRSLSTSTVNSHFRFCADFASAQTCTFVHVRSVSLTLVSVLTFLFFLCGYLRRPISSLFLKSVSKSQTSRGHAFRHMPSRGLQTSNQSILTDSRCFHDIPIVLSPCYLDHSVRFTC
jgi:hypothetical protein